jgi:hypothetical protein
MLDYNKARLLMDFELPSGNIFQGPVTMVHVPRCGIAPAQGFIVTNSKITLTNTQRTELIAKYVAAGYTEARAIAFADSFVSPSTLRVGVIEGSKAISVSRARDEHAVGALSTPDANQNWVMYEGLALAQQFDLNAYVTTDSIKSLIDHPNIRGKGWELVNPTTITGLPNDNLWDIATPTLFSTSAGWPNTLGADGPRAWFAANSRDYVYCCIPVGRYSATYATFASIVVRRPRTHNDRNVSLVYFRPQDAARSQYTIQCLAIGYNMSDLVSIMSSTGQVFSGMEGATSRLDAFKDLPLSAPTYSALATDLMSDWPNMFQTCTRYLEADGDYPVSRELFAYGWLDAPRSCSWTYADIHTFGTVDTKVIIVDATSTLQCYADAQLRRFIDQIVLHGNVTASEVVKLNDAKAQLTTSEKTGIYARSRIDGYSLSQNIEGLLPIAIKADDAGEDPRAMVLAGPPDINLGQVADKARTLKKLPALCFLPKGDQKGGMYGVEIITFTGTVDGQGVVQTMSFAMTQFGDVLADATVEDVMVATTLGASWITVGVTEAQVAAYYFNGAISKADARTWIDAEDVEAYHSPAYKFDDYHCHYGWNGWPAIDGAELATLTTNQLVGDRANTASMLFAMSSWSVGRRLRYSYITIAEMLAAEVGNETTVALRPATGWSIRSLKNCRLSDYNFQLNSLASSLAPIVMAGEDANGTGAKVCFEVRVVTKASTEYIGVALESTPSNFEHWIRPTGELAPPLSAGASPGVLVAGDVIVFALDRSVPGAARLSLYKNGVYTGHWNVADNAVFRPRFGTELVNAYRLTTVPDSKPAGYGNWTDS